MLLAMLLAAGLVGPCDAPHADPLRTVCPYLDALQRLDHEAMASLWAPDVVWVQSDGTREPLDRERTRNFRDFEREMRTRWLSTVDSVHGDSAFITRREANDYYDLLGVGDRTQREMYVVRGRRIGEMHILGSSHAGPDYDSDSVYTAFKRWVLDTMRVRDPELIGDDVLRFTGKSAAPMREWLERWRSSSHRP
jgi:hypothetical protein